MVGAIIASGSRGGFIGFIVMLLVLSAFLVRTRPLAVVAGVLVVMCVLPVLPSTYWRRIASITDSSKDDFGSADARKTLIRESWQAYMDNPAIGVGAGEFKDWNNERRVESWHEAHNVWLQVAAELGTLGLAVYVFLVLRAPLAVYQTRRLLRRVRRTRGATPSTLTPFELAQLDSHSAAMAASVAGWLTCALFASVAYNWTFYYLLALAATPRDVLRASLPRHVRSAATAGARRIALAEGREVRA
jgi:O-antigen ligase